MILETNLKATSSGVDSQKQLESILHIESIKSRCKEVPFRI